jgi:hypothetical protein
VARLGRRRASVPIGVRAHDCRALARRRPDAGNASRCRLLPSRSTAYPSDGGKNMPLSEKVRWDILGPGGISSRLLQDAGRAANFSVVATGCRSRDRAAEFASRFGIAGVHGLYDALLADQEVDAVCSGVPFTSPRHDDACDHGWQTCPRGEAPLPPPGPGRLGVQCRRGGRPGPDGDTHVSSEQSRCESSGSRPSDRRE